MVKCVFVFIFLTVYLQCAFAVSKLDYLKEENFQIGISSIGVRLSNSTNTQCGKELQIFLESVEENKLWALKLTDSFGVIPKTIYWGNYFWFSSKEFCEDLNEPFRISLSDRYNYTNTFNTTSPFSVRFWMIYFNFTSPIHTKLAVEFEHYIHVGLCLPQSCSEEEVIHYSQSYFAEKSFAPQQRYDIEMDVVDAKTPEFRWSFFLKTGMLISLSYLALSAILTFIADRIHKSHQKSEENQPIGDRFSKLEQFILCFHLKNNYRKILDVEISKNFLPTIAGMRTTICMAITFTHVHYYASLAANNLPIITSKAECLHFQPIAMSVYYLDVFFIISSFLLVYYFLSNSKVMQTIKMNSLKENVLFFLKIVLSRYVRILPILLTSLVLTDTLYDLMDMYSPLRMGEFSFVYCKERWWYNILFINNFLDFQYMCSSWTWYLACDMQLFIFFAVMLFIYAKNESLAKSLFLILLVAGVTIGFLQHYYYGFTFQIDVMVERASELYNKPWNRINSYSGGALAGWVLYKTRKHPVKLNVFWKSTFWIFTFCFFLMTSMVFYWRSAPTWIASIIMTLGKLIFAFYISGVILMCEWGHGGLLHKLLTSRPLLVLNKLCFAIYLISPQIIIGVFGLQPEATQLNEINFLVNGIAITIYSIVASFFVVLLIELPMDKIRSMILPTKTNKENPSKSEKLTKVEEMHYPTSNNNKKDE